MFSNHKKEIILVALDHSPTSRSTARLAIQIARARNQIIYGLFVVDSQLVDNPSSDYQSELGNFDGTLSRPALIIRLEELGHQALGELETLCREAGVTVITDIVYGKIPETIQQKADRCDLLAVGRRGNGQAENAHLLGQHFRAICHTIRKPILVGGEEKGGLHRVLVAAPEEALVREIHSYLSLFDKAFFPEAVTHGGREGTGEVPQKPDLPVFQSQLHSEAVIQVIGRSSQDIAAEALQQKADLVVLAGYPPKNPLRWLVGSFTEQVIRAVPAPVLLLYPPFRQ